MRRMFNLLWGIVLLSSGCGTVQQPANATSQAPIVTPNQTVGQPKQRLSMGQRPDHIVIVIEENHAYTEIKGNPQAPFINSLMNQGASFTQYHGVEHPSQPNYLDLFSGSNQGVTSDSCPHTFSAPNLGSELIQKKLTFGGYSEDLPSVGFTGCTNRPWLGGLGATYARKHNPWSDFTNVPASDNMPFTRFPKDYSKLPTIAFVVPNQVHDMHSGSIADGDKWLRDHIRGYVNWASTHNSLLIVTWDEDDQSASNVIPTFFVGPMVRTGVYHEPLNHFNLLRTLEDIYGLGYLGASAHVRPISNVWR